MMTLVNSIIIMSTNVVTFFSKLCLSPSQRKKLCDTILPK